MPGPLSCGLQRLPGTNATPVAPRPRRLNGPSEVPASPEQLKARRCGRQATHHAHFFFFGAGMIDSDEAFIAVEGAAEPGSFFFFGFLTSLFPRIWPLAMVVSIPASVTL